MDVLDLQAVLRFDSTDYTRGLSVAKKAAQTFAKVGAAAFTAVTGVAIGFGKSAVETGANFDRSMSQVYATMGDKAQEMTEYNGEVVSSMDALRDFAKKMGSETAFTASQAADALNYMALAGYDASTSIGMLPNVLNLAAAGSMELARASDVVTDVQTAFGISLERTSQMVDEMAKAASTGNTSVEQLGDAFLVVGGLAKNINGGMVTLSDGTQTAVDGVQELEIALTAMANAGIKGSEAGTHMRNMLLKLASPAKDGEEALDKLGVKAFDVEGKMKPLSEIFRDMKNAIDGDLEPSFRKFYEQASKLSEKEIAKELKKDENAFKLFGISVLDSQNKIKTLEQFMAEAAPVMEKGISQQDKLQAISAIFNARDVASAEALLSAMGQDWDSIGENVLNAEGAAKEMAKAQQENLTGSMNQFNSAMEGVKIELSEELIPTLTEFINLGTSGLHDITNAFQGGGGIAAAIPEMGKALTKIIKEIIKKLPTIIKTVVGIITEIVRAIATNAPEIVGAIVEVIPDLVDGIGKILPTLIDGFFKVVVGIANGLADLMPELLPKLIDTITGTVNAILDNAEPIMDAAIRILEVVSEALIDNLPVLTEAVLKIVERIVDYATDPEVLEKIIEMAAKVIINVSAALLAAAPKLLIGVGKIIKAVVDNIVNTDWTELGRKLLNNITDALSKASGKLTEWWDGWAQEIGKYAVIAYNSFIDTWAPVVGWFENKWHEIQGAFSGVADWFGKIFGDAWQKVKDVFSPMGDTFSKVGNSILTGLKSIINSLIDGINNIIATPFNGLNAAFELAKKTPIFSWLPTVSVPEIPKLAQGGVLKKGQMAFLEGQGDEAVIPLSQNTEWIDRVADRLLKRQPQYNININIDNVSAGGDNSAENIADTIVDIIIERLRGEYASGAY